MSESFVQVNIPIDPDANSKLKTFTSVDGNSNTVNSEAVVLVDGTTGAEVHPLTDTQLRATPVPVLPSLPAGAATEATLAARATEATLSTRASEATLATRATETTLGTRASEATLATRATESTLGTRASEATLAAIKADVDRIPSSPAQEHVLANSPTSARLSDGASFYKATTPTDTQPVSVVSLPLPTGASTEATLASIKAKTDNIDVAISTRTKPSDTQKVDGSAVTQPISASSLPLPAGAATESTLAAISSNTAVAAPGGLQNGAQTSVPSTSGGAVVLAANPNRKAAVIQNLGSISVRIGTTGVTGVTGIQLTPGRTMTLEPPFIPQGDIVAISESGSSTVFATEVT